MLSGLRGLGAEVAKNLVLMGVGSLTLHDPHPTCWADLAAQVRVFRVSMLPPSAGLKGSLFDQATILSLVFPLRGKLGKEQG